MRQISAACRRLSFVLKIFIVPLPVNMGHLLARVVKINPWRMLLYTEKVCVTRRNYITNWG